MTAPLSRRTVLVADGRAYEIADPAEVRPFVRDLTYHTIRLVSAPVSVWDWWRSRELIQLCPRCRGSRGPLGLAIHTCPDPRDAREAEVERQEGLL